MGKVDDYTAGRSQGLILARGDCKKKTVSRDWRKKSSSGISQE